MEARQLALFVLACQHLSHAEAAALYGISPSAVSESISNLEAELGLELFQRGPLGQVPTDSARWLFQKAEPLLQVLEVATAKQPVTRVDYLSVSSSLQFMFGKLSRVLALTGRKLRERHPGTVTRIEFQTNDHGHKPQCDDVFFSYQESEDNSATHLFDDDWVIVSASPLNPQAAALQNLQRAEHLWLPMLSPALEVLIRNYSSSHGLPQPQKLKPDSDPFIFLDQQREHGFLLAPRNLVIGGVLRYRFFMQPLETVLVSPVVAHIRAISPEKQQLAHEFLTLLDTVLKEPTPILYYDPIVSLRQLRLITTLAHCKNMSMASRLLNVAQPALSVQLKKLEKVMGVTLFERHRSGMTILPDMGARVELLQDAARIAAQIRSEAQTQKHNQHHDIFIGITALTSELYGFQNALAKAIAKCMQDHPETRIHIAEKKLSTLHHELRNGHIDIVLSEQTLSNFQQFELINAGALGMACFNRNADLTLTANELLTNLPVILPPEGDLLLNKTGITIRPFMEIERPSLRFAVARESTVSTVLPQQLFEQFNQDQTGIFRHFTPLLPVIITAQFLPDRKLSHVEKTLTDYLQDFCKAIPNSEKIITRFPK